MNKHAKKILKSLLSPVSKNNAANNELIIKSFILRNFLALATFVLNVPCLLTQTKQQLPFYLSININLCLSTFPSISVCFSIHNFYLRSSKWLLGGVGRVGDGVKAGMEILPECTEESTKIEN